jgi:hypothetical protein
VSKRKAHPYQTADTFVASAIPLTEYGASSARHCQEVRHQMSVPELRASLEYAEERGACRTIMRLLENELWKRRRRAENARIAKLPRQPRRVAAESKSKVKDRFVYDDPTPKLDY